MQLRTAGATYRQIGQALGTSHESARKDVMAGLAEMRKELVKQTQAYLALELQRLELPLLKLLPQVNIGNVQAIDQWRKLSESRRRLLGIDRQRLRIVPDVAEAQRELAELLLSDDEELPE